MATQMDELGAAAVGIMHWSKSPTTVALDRVIGSRAVSATARAVLGVGEDRESPGSCLLVLAKSNLGPMGTPALCFKIEGAFVPDPDGGFPLETSRVVWTGEHKGVHSSDLFPNGEKGEERSSVAGAVEFLLALLDGGGGAVDVGDLEAGREAAGISERTLRRARKELGLVVEPVRDDSGKIVRWVVRMP